MNTQTPTPVREGEALDWQAEAERIIDVFGVKRAKVKAGPGVLWGGLLTGCVYINKERFYFRAWPCHWKASGYRGVVVVVKPRRGAMRHDGLMQLWANHPLQCDLNRNDIREWVAAKMLDVGRTIEEIGVALEASAHERLEWLLDYRARLAALEITL